MTTLVVDRPVHASRESSAAARRAVSRWAWRLFSREWRQQIIISSVIALAVAAAVCSVTVVYNVPASPAADFGTAHQSLHFDVTNTDELAQIEAAAENLGTIELIGHGSIPIPGSVDSFDVRAQDPHGRFAASTLRLRDGHFPNAPTEVAITDGVAQTLAIHIGSTITIAGNKLTVVGTVENPLELSDEFALLHPSATGAINSVTVLATATEEEITSLRALATRPSLETRGSTVNKAAAAAMLAVSTVLFLLVALVAAAGFAVVAHRRMRQLGMLAAVGATDRQLRMVLIIHGAVLGVVASVSGTIAGLAVWFGFANHLEDRAGHRIDPSNLPWPLLIGALVAGVLVPIAAAWWPARAMSRVPVVDALSARPPAPRRADTSMLLASLFLVGGVVLTGLSNQSNPILLIGGMTALVVGILLACPTAIRLVASVAKRMPVAIRVALRDLGRHQARAGAALAAISVALGIPIAIVLVASAADRSEAQSAREGNLADTQLLIRIGRPDNVQPFAPDLTASQQADMQAVIDGLATKLDAAPVPLEMAVDPTVGSPDSRPMIELGEPVPGNDHVFSTVRVVVATPQLLDIVGIDPSTIPSDAEVLTSGHAAPILVGIAEPVGRSRYTPKTHTIAPPPYTSLPTAFITQTAMQNHNLQTTTVGWILRAPKAITGAQVAMARQAASSSGLTVEARHGPSSRAALRTAAIAIGALFALAIVAMTVGTIRSESADELRTLTATGASSTIRRSLTATTAASLAICGVILGAIGAYLGLIGSYVHHLDRLAGVPVAHLVAALIGVPLLSCAVGWCLGGREPTTFTRQIGE